MIEIIFRNNDRLWHRLNGPAVIFSDGSNYYYIKTFYKKNK